MPEKLATSRLQTPLGTTGLSCSVAGLGCGGMNRLGLRKGGSFRAAIEVVHCALDLGITVFDTAKRYGTEPAIGAALRGRREKVIIASKVDPLTPDNRIDPAFITEQIDDSLRALGLETIDIMQLHGVKPEDYRRIIDHCLEPMQRARSAGKIRHIGITELWNEDLRHDMLKMALEDDYFDVMLVGCNMLNSGAARSIFPKAAERGIATFLMFAVRKALAEPPLLRSICKRLVHQGYIDPDLIDIDDPLGFLVADGVAETLTEAAYRYCRHLPGVDVVLTGTVNEAHMRDNIAAIEGAPLPPQYLERIDEIFGKVDSVTGEV